MKEIKLGILGFGTVGSGVVEAILQNNDLIFNRTGIRLIIEKIADRDISHDRGISLPESILTTDAESIISDDSIDIIVELVGGTSIAKSFIENSLKFGKPVVTANKALLADHGFELYALASSYNKGIYYEAAVGGGIPIIRSQKDGLISNHINQIYGILNGTCNYILTRMENENLSFNDILIDAQKLGYAETPPDLDIDGIDTAHKAIILASMAYGSCIPMSSCYVSGIRNLSKIDVNNANELGYSIKLLSIIKKYKNKIELSVETTLVPKSHMISSVNESFNAIFIKGDIVGDTMYYGRGAGKLPTASAVISDIIEASNDILYNKKVPSSVSVMLQHKKLGCVLPEKIIKRCYLRLSLQDQPGAMAKVMNVLGDFNINVASVIQKESHPDGIVPVVILTESAEEKDFQNAVKVISSLDICNKEIIRYRIEDFDYEGC